MESEIGIALLIVLILCFALVLAWLAAKGDPACCIKMTVLPPREAGSSDVRIETPNGAVILSLRCCTQETGQISPPVPEGAADPE